MTKSEIDRYFSDDWRKIKYRCNHIFFNLRGKGNVDDLIQNAYLEVIAKAEKIADLDMLGRFVSRFVASQIMWSTSKHNKEVDHTNIIQERCYKAATVVSCYKTDSDDNNNIVKSKLLCGDFEEDIDLTNKINMERWYQDRMYAFELWKRKSVENRQFADIFIMLNGNRKAIAKHLDISINSVNKRFERMKEEVMIKNGTDHYLIAGCGPSIKNVKNRRIRATVIGVNDVNRYIDVDYHVLIDPMSSFDRERRAIIEDTHSEILFTHLPDNKISTNARNKVKIDFLSTRGFFEFKDKIPKSHHSTFVAACLAVKMGAKTIAFAGMDLTKHPKIFNKKLTDSKKHLVDFVRYCVDKKIRVINLGVDNILTDIDGVENITYPEWIEIISNEK